MYSSYFFTQKWESRKERTASLRVCVCDSLFLSNNFNREINSKTEQPALQYKKCTYNVLTSPHSFSIDMSRLVCIWQDVWWRHYLKTVILKGYHLPFIFLLFHTTQILCLHGYCMYIVNTE